MVKKRIQWWQRPPVDPEAPPPAPKKSAKQTWIAGPKRQRLTADVWIAGPKSKAKRSISSSAKQSASIRKPKVTLAGPKKRK